jgi:hypothetical protein
MHAGTIQAMPVSVLAKEGIMMQLPQMTNSIALRSMIVFKRAYPGTPRYF